MIIREHPIAILGRGQKADGVNVAVAQTRVVEGNAIKREGCVAFVFLTKEGKQIDALLTPEEAQMLGVLAIACSCTAAGEPPPTMNMTPPGGGPIAMGTA